MKLLTIAELKALKVGDWVWVVYKKQYGTETFYSRISSSMSGNYVKNPIDIAGVFLFMEDYGTKWLAYKNKEQAECKGEIVELPCLRDIPAFYYHNKEIRRKQLIFVNVSGAVNFEVYCESEFDVAERRLAELKGEPQE